MHPRRYIRRLQSKPELVSWGGVHRLRLSASACSGSGYSFIYRRLSRCKRRGVCPDCNQKFWLLALVEDLDYGFDGKYYYVRRIPEHERND